MFFQAAFTCSSLIQATLPNIANENGTWESMKTSGKSEWQLLYHLHGHKTCYSVTKENWVVLMLALSKFKATITCFLMFQIHRSLTAHSEIRKVWSSCNESSEWSRRSLRGWSIFHMRSSRESWDCSAWTRKGSRGNLIYVHKYLVGGNTEDGARLFTVAPTDSTAGNKYKWELIKFCLNTRKHLFCFFTTNRLPRGVVEFRFA